jgi:hypothetical protein
MKSKPYELDGKIFRYDFDHCVVEYIAKADAEMVADEAEWEQKHDRKLYNIDDDGYMVLDEVGLHKKNWINKEARDEYLSEWAFELDEELGALAAEFISEERYTPSSTAGDYSPGNPWDAPGMSVKDFI